MCVNEVFMMITVNLSLRFHWVHMPVELSGKKHALER